MVQRARRRRSLLRPTAARVRQAVFNSLAARIPGSRVLDLFAGSGAFGLGMLARGAARVVFVEGDAVLAEGIRRRVAKEGWADRAQILTGDVIAAVRRLDRRGESFDLLFMDPPYGGRWIPRTLRAIAQTRLVAPGGLIIAEGHWRDRPGDEAGFRRLREVRYGETALWYYAGSGEDGHDRGDLSGEF
ncbi:MAG: RsmD family RNA methyltransferase [Armatimonadota bacterium]|nr:RsmD family RNA methyltransferase [Armatimonadota bacterium]MDR7505415.1 RsmD family RNA methyltransferase [Armatimonadota bacterium]